jgi:hypothetical protein
LPEEALEQSNEEVIKRLLARDHESINAKIDNLSVTVILSEESSINDPYLVVKTHAKQNELTLVINVAHPYWIELETKDNRFHFLNQCIYDGISEWKAQFQYGTFKPDTIKRIKDFFLRLKMEIT